MMQLLAAIQMQLIAASCEPVFAMTGKEALVCLISILA